MPARTNKESVEMHHGSVELFAAAGGTWQMLPPCGGALMAENGEAYRVHPTHGSKCDPWVQVHT